jgi:hypothetical protein
LCHGPPTKSGFRTKYESCAKEIIKFINLKIINNMNNDKYLNNNESIDELQKKTKVEKKKKLKKKRLRSQIDFEKQVMIFFIKLLKLKNKQAQKKYNKKIEFFYMFF